MKQEKKLSVIIPTYNSETYLKQAIDSVLNQTYTNIELIIVDDNSQDGTRQIVLDYAKKDERVKHYFFEENKGPGIARNFGLTKATGHYLTLVDHDDFQELNRYELMINKLEKDNTDACVTYSSDYVQETKTFRKNVTFFKEGKYNLDDKAVYDKFQYSFIPPWSKIIKTQHVKDFHLSFAEKGVKFDDMMFHALFAISAKSFSVVGQRLYYHRYFEKSITYNNTNHVFLAQNLLSTIEQTLRKCEEYKDINKQKVYNLYLPLLEKSYKRLAKEDLAKIKEDICKYFKLANKTHRLRSMQVKRILRQAFNLIKKDKKLKPR